MKIVKTFLSLALSIIFLLLIALIILLSPFFFLSGTDSQIYATLEDVQPTEVAIVFGAGVKDDGTPSDALKDRLIVAAELYNAGKIEKILVSGDNTSEDYNEPDAMSAYLIQLGVPAENISADYAGRRTYDTCMRAKNIWSINEALLITQDFHLPRALFTCNAVGIESFGISASLQPYVLEDYYRFREWFATIEAILDVYLIKPDYVSGEPEKL